MKSVLMGAATLLVGLALAAATAYGIVQGGGSVASSHGGPGLVQYGTNH